MKVEYTGFSITWNATKTGITVEAPCTGPGLKGWYNIVITSVKSIIHYRHCT